MSHLVSPPTAKATPAFPQERTQASVRVEYPSRSSTFRNVFIKKASAQARLSATPDAALVGKRPSVVAFAPAVAVQGGPEAWFARLDKASARNIPRGSGGRQQCTAGASSGTR